MNTHVEFCSDDFPPYEDEGKKVNAGRYGKRLADFLVRGLREKGFTPLEPIAEDWGWMVPIKNDEFKLWIGCGNYDEYPDGFLCFIEPHQPTIRRFFFLGKINTSSKVNALQEAIDQLLSAHPRIQNKRWWSFEEFKRGST